MPAKDVADLKTWIAQGAYWPETPGVASGPASTGAPAKDKGEKDGSANSTPQLVKVAHPPPVTRGQLACFEKNVRPILVNNCYNCHSDAFKEAGGLRMDVGIAIFNGGNSGSANIAGHPEKSLLFERVKSDVEKKRIPQERKESLPREEVAVLEHWIKDRAVWPDESEKLPKIPALIAASYVKLRKEWWSWQPLTVPAVPNVHNTASSSALIDRFALGRPEAKKLAPVKDTDPLTLIRRLSCDLTGLPPTPAQVVLTGALPKLALLQGSLGDRDFVVGVGLERKHVNFLEKSHRVNSTGMKRDQQYPRGKEGKATSKPSSNFLPNGESGDFRNV